MQLNKQDFEILVTILAEWSGWLVERDRHAFLTVVLQESTRRKDIQRQIDLAGKPHIAAVNVISTFEEFGPDSNGLSITCLLIDKLKLQVGTHLVDKLEDISQHINCASLDLHANNLQLQVPPLGISEPRLGLASISSMRSHRSEGERVLMTRVQAFWVDSMLHQATNGLTDLEQDYTIQIIPECEINRTSLFEGLQSAFDICSRLLLIGDKGIGKTVQLLRIAHWLLALAHADDLRRVPVILNLASWGQTQASLRNWIDSELKSRYKIAADDPDSTLIGNNRLIYLLDGLDEVKSEHRDACVRAINIFAAEVGASFQTVICCRTTEFYSLTEKPLSGITPIAEFRIGRLTTRQVERFLKENLGRYASSNGKIVSDDLIAFTRNPFHLWLLMQTRRNVDDRQLILLRDDNVKREFLFEKYFDVVYSSQRLFQYQLHDTKRFLSHIAQGMNLNSESIFMVDQMQMQWLTRRSRTLYFIITRLTFIILLSPIAAAVLNLMSNSNLNAPIRSSILLLAALSVGCIALLFNERFITPRVSAVLVSICTLPVSIFFLLDSTIELRLVVTTLVAVLVGIGAWVNFTLGLGGMHRDSRDISTVQLFGWSRRKGLVGLFIMAVVALILFALIQLTGKEELRVLLAVGIGWAPLGITGGFIGKSAFSERVTDPSWGIWASFHNGIYVFGIMLMSCTLMGTWANLTLGYDLATSLLYGITTASFLAAVLGLYFGVMDAWKHLVLRVLLSRAVSLPFKIIEFLNFAVDLTLLRRVGSGYIFLHRTMQDHLASLRTTLGKESEPSDPKVA